MLLAVIVIFWHCHQQLPVLWQSLTYAALPQFHHELLHISLKFLHPFQLPKCQIFLHVDILKLPNNLLTQILLSLFYFILRVFSKDLHKTQIIEEVFRKLILFTVPKHPEKHVQIFLTVKWRLSKHIPHLITDCFNLPWF